MPRTVNVNYVTKEVKILLHDSETESLAAATAIAAAESAQEAKDVVVDNLQDSLDAIDAKTETEKTELDGYTETKKTEIATLGQGYVDSTSQKVDEANTILAAIRNEYGYPFTAATAADMTDTSKIYVYVGSETGYTNGNWYYYDGTAWVSGGVYNATAFETDKTLTVSGAAADAKVVGDSSFLAKKTISSNTDIDNIKVAGMYIVSSASIARTLSNWPTQSHGHLNVYNYQGNKTDIITGCLQVCVSGGSLYFRRFASSLWTDWKQMASYDDNLCYVEKGYIDSNTDIDSLVLSGTYSVTTSGVASTLINYPFDSQGTVLVFAARTGASHSKVQIAIDNVKSNIKVRALSSGNWSEWKSVLTEDVQQLIVMARGDVRNNTDLNDIVTPGVYNVYSNSSARTLINYPSSYAGNIIVFSFKKNLSSDASRGIVQLLKSKDNVFIRDRGDGGVWSDWSSLSNKSNGGSEIPSNPYANIDFQNSYHVTSSTHIHITNQTVFNRAKAHYQHLAISNYHPGRPVYPLSAKFTDTDEVLASPSCEAVYFNGSSKHLHMCPIGSFMTWSDNNGSGKGDYSGEATSGDGYVGTYEDFFKEASAMMQYANAGCIQINHPHYSDTLTVNATLKILASDYNNDVRCVEIYRGGAALRGEDDATVFALDILDGVLATGRQLFGTANPDWGVSTFAEETATAGYGYNHLLVNYPSELECLLAYRNGRFYTTIFNDDLKLSYFGVYNGVATFIANRAGTIKFVTAIRTVTVENSASSDFTLQDDDVFVRAEIESNGNRLFTNAIMLGK